MKVPELSIEGWAKVVGAVSGTLALLFTLWKPLKRWLRDVFDRSIKASLKRCKEEIRRLLKEDILAADIKLLGDTTTMARANHDRLEMVDAAIRAQGVALAELPRIAGQMEGLPRAIDALSNAMRDMSENVGIIRGKIEERERWDGQERRNQNYPVDYDRRKHE